MELGDDYFPAGLYMVYHEIESIPFCEECGKNKVELISFNLGFRKFCCRSCSRKATVRKTVEEYNKKNGTSYTNIRQFPKIKEKADKSMIDRYGSLMPINDNPEIKAKAEKTSLKKYGVKKPIESQTIRKKMEESRKNRTDKEKEITKNKRKSNFLKKYGVENPMQYADFFEKAKQTRKEKYGVEHCLQNPDIAKKQVESMKETCLKKYNVSSVLKLESVREKSKITIKEKYGVDHPMKNKQIQQKAFKNAQTTLQEKHGVTNPMLVDGSMEKRITTTLEKYGFEYSFQCPTCKEKSKETMLERYGVEHSILIPGNMEKVQSKQFSSKQYCWSTGEISQVQGYEPIVLSELEEKGYTFADVKTSPIDMPIIKYFYRNKWRRYIPDIFIPFENRIIEVKSEYTLTKEWDKNMLKFKAVKEAGFNFKLEVR